jgi:hypothetical protein
MGQPEVIDGRPWFMSFIVSSAFHFGVKIWLAFMCFAPFPQASMMPSC